MANMKNPALTHGVSSPSSCLRQVRAPRGKPSSTGSRPWFSVSRVINALTTEADGYGVECESGSSSAEVCGAEMAGLRGRIDALLAKAGTTDGSTITTGENVDDGFMVAKSNGKKINKGEITGISTMLGGEFQLERVRGNGGGKVYVVKPRIVMPNEGGVNGGRTSRREERREVRRKRQEVVRATNPHLNPVES